MRFGYVVRGIIYLLPGLLALQMAFGPGGKSISQSDSITLIGRQPFGRILLVVLAIGLAGYALWGLIRCFLDPLHKGRTPGGILKRMGFLWSAIAYVGLLMVTLGILSGRLSHAGHDQWPQQLMAKPLGEWLLGIIGVCWIAGAGVGQIVAGWKGSFRDDFDPAHVGQDTRRWAVPLGRFGIITRGVLFAGIGMFLIASALHANPGHKDSLSDEWLALARQPLGRGLVTIASLGLIAFGVFSMMCSRWMRIHISPGAPQLHSSHSQPA
jgi:hypothetical protein